MLLLDIYSTLILLVIFIVLRYWIKRWLTRQLGGYTGIVWERPSRPARWWAI